MSLRYAAVAMAVLGATLACQSRPVVGIEQGRDLYAANGCAACHGPSGRGDGPVGRTLVPPPRDFTEPSAYTNGSDIDSITRTLGQGIDRQGAKMPAFAHLSDAERRSLALYVVSLRKP